LNLNSFLVTIVSQSRIAALRALYRFTRFGQVVSMNEFSQGINPFGAVLTVTFLHV
jgi:hypothetical protein